MVVGDIMNNLLDEYKINSLKILNVRIFTKDNKNIIELLYELFLLTKESEIDEVNQKE